MSVLLGLLVALPAVVGLGLLAAPVLGLRGERAAGALAVATAGLVFILGVLVAWRHPSLTVTFLPGLASGLAVDGLSAALALTVAVAALVVVVFTVGSPETGRRRLFGLLLLFTAAMLLVVTATDLVLLLAGWELMGLTSYALIGHSWREPERVQAGVTAFLTTRLADVGLYVAVGAGLAVGTTALDGLDGDSGWARVAAAGVAIAALGKSAQLPFSGWLSGAMLGPSSASALLHSATMVAAGGYLLLRLHPLLAATGLDTTVAWVGAVTAVVMGAVALTQRDLKQLLAASTCAQLGFVVLAAGTGSITGGVLALVAHAATKALLFLCAGTWLDALGTKDLTALRGVGRRYPVVGRAAVVGALSLAGVPPLALWVGKEAALAQAGTALYLVGLVGAALSAAYGTRVLAVVLDAPAAHPALDTERRGTRMVSVTGRVAVTVLALAVVAVGITGLIDTRLRPEGTALLVSALLAVAVAAGVLVADARGVAPAPPRLLLEWVGTTALLMLIGRGVVAGAQALATADARFEAGTARVFTARRPAATVAGLDEQLTRGIDTLAAATRRLGVAARRPQTGQLHTYFAQAVIALVVLAAILVLVR